MQIKTTMEYHITPVIMTYQKDKNKHWKGYGEKEILVQSCEFIVNSL